jgi:hypothetical protein
LSPSTTAAGTKFNGRWKTLPDCRPRRSTSTRLRHRHWPRQRGPRLR